MLVGVTNNINWLALAATRVSNIHQISFCGYAWSRADEIRVSRGKGTAPPASIRKRQPMTATGPVADWQLNEGGPDVCADHLVYKVSIRPPPAIVGAVRF